MKIIPYSASTALLLFSQQTVANQDNLPPGNVSAAEMYSQEQIADQTLSMLEENLTRITLICNAISDKESAKAVTDNLDEARKTVNDTLAHIVADPDLKIHVEAILNQSPERKQQLSDLMHRADEALGK